MKYYFFTLHKTEKRNQMTTEEVLPVLNAHTAYFKHLGQEGKCLMAGPFSDQTTGFGAGCYVFASETEDEARKLAEGDPLFTEGIYNFQMREWNKVVPE